jgi:hypothetical protein
MTLWEPEVTIEDKRKDMGTQGTASSKKKKGEENWDSLYYRY